DQLDAAVLGEADVRALVPGAADACEKRRDAPPAYEAALGARPCARLEAAPLGERERLVHHRLELAAVVEAAAGRAVGNRGLRDHVAPAQRDAVDLHLPRRLVDQ